MQKVILVVLLLISTVAFAEGPRKRLEPARTLCDGVRCRVVFTDWETSGHETSFILDCSSVAFCTIELKYLSWTREIFTYEIEPGKQMVWRSAYPRVLRTYCDPSHCHLSWRLEARGLSAWYVGKTNGAVEKVLQPVIVEVMP